MGKSLVSCFFLRHSVYKSACFKSSSPETHKFSWGNTAGLETPGLTPSARFVDIPISDVSHYRRAWACGGRVSWSPRAGGHRADILADGQTHSCRAQWSDSPAEAKRSTTTAQLKTPRGDNLTLSLYSPRLSKFDSTTGLNRRPFTCLNNFSRYVFCVQRCMFTAIRYCSSRDHEIQYYECNTILLKYNTNLYATVYTCYLWWHRSAQSITVICVTNGRTYRL